MSSGLFIGLRLAPEDCATLAAWAASLSISRRIPADRLHMTMLKHRTLLQYFAPLGVFKTPVVVDLQRCYFKKHKIETGGMALVLTMPNAWLCQRRATIKRELCLPKDKAKFVPHVSLCYGAEAFDNASLASLQPPLTELRLIEEFANPVEVNYAASI